MKWPKEEERRIDEKEVSAMCHVFTYCIGMFISVQSEEVWYHESNQALRQVRFWIAEYSLPRYSKESLHRIILYVMVLLMCRARDRLKAARIAGARPDPEKASATQDLHQALRVQMYTCMHVLKQMERRVDRMIVLLL